MPDIMTAGEVAEIAAQPMSSEQPNGHAQGIRLNLGAGKQPMEGWINLDIENGFDIRQPLPYADGSVDHIRASHVLEHIETPAAIAAVQDWVRALKDGGSLSIAVPSLEWIVKAYANQVQGLPLEGYLFGGQIDQHDYHKSAWDRKKLTALLRACGLGAVRPWYSHMQDCASLPVSLNLRGTKLPCDLDHINLVMTMPRHTFTTAGKSLLKASTDLRLNVIQGKGVFWCQGLDRLLLDSVKREAEWILTADYDTVFTTADVLTLVDVAEQFGLDAVFPVQSKRQSKDTLLMRLVDEKGLPMAQVPVAHLRKPVVEAQTGHFGLTLLRVEALKKVPVPWFVGRPAPDGHYGDGRIDDDIHFWNQWRSAGLKLWMANDCVVGHMEEVVSWPNGETYETSHQYVDEYEEKGKPPWSR